MASECHIKMANLATLPRTHVGWPLTTCGPQVLLCMAEHHETQRYELRVLYNALLIARTLTAMLFKKSLRGFHIFTHSHLPCVTSGLLKLLGSREKQV